MARIHYLLLACLLIQTLAGQVSGRDLRAEEEEEELFLLRRALQHLVGDEVYEGRREQVKLGEDDGKAECQPLEGLLAELAKSSHWTRIFDFVSKQSGRKITADFFWKNLAGMLGGHDLRQPADRHRLACKVYDSSNLEELLTSFGLPASAIQQFKYMLKKSFTQFGGVDRVEALFHLVYEYGSWAAVTGFPTIPLKKNVTQAEVEEEVQEWLRIYYGFKSTKSIQRVIDGAFREMLLPFHLNPNYAALTITDASSTEQLLEKLCLDKEEYKSFVKFDYPTMLVAEAEIARILLKILNDLIERGFLKI